MRQSDRIVRGIAALTLCAAMCVVGHGAAPPVAGKAAGPAALDEALTRLQSGDARGATAMLRLLTSREPGNIQAWRALGRAFRQARDYAQAVVAYQHAVKLAPDSPRDLFGLGSSYAGLHDTEHAFEWLGRAAATHRYDMTEIGDDANLAEFRGDPRYLALLPAPADFDHPFVETVKVIREWRGEAAGDQFGWIARNIGDVDGDGVNDIVTSAPTHGAGNSNAGRIYVYSVGSGRLLWTADGQPGDQLGTGVEAAGDTNHDGVPDVVASGPAGAGVAHIYSGRDGRILQTFRAPNADETFGNHVSGAGDVDGDGYADVIVGSPGKEGESKVPGHAYVYSGKDGSLLLTLSGERAGDGFGSTVAGYSDAHQHLLVVGAPGAGPAHHGRVYAYDGRSTQPKFTLEADASGRMLGYMFVSVPGDVDGDGVGDVYASDWSNAARGHSTGRIYMVSGRTGQRLYALTGESMGDGFGTSPSMAGDVDGDGRADLIVGAWQFSGAAESGGKAYLYSGRDGRLLKTYTCRTPGDTFGFDAVGLGDVDGDGTADLLITSGWSAVNGHHSGRVFVISSGVTARPKAAGSRLIGDLPRRGALPLLQLPGIDTEYGVVEAAGGARLRSIVTRPAGTTARLPAVLFVPWLSCDSVDFSASADDGWSLMQKRLIMQSNMLWMRVDKSGVGDSLGTACAQLDYETELAQYRAALDALYQRPDVDPARIVVFGASMGATYAPLVATGHRVAGVVVWGGGATTWFERMLAFERHALELGGTDPARLSGEMKARERFFARYLLQGESPAAIAQSDPELGAVWTRIVGASGATHYGRPPAFHQQAQQQDWPAAWARIDAPVLAVYGGYDWFESAAAVRLIADSVNRAHPGGAQFRELAGINHHFTRYPSPEAAYAEHGGVADPGEFVQLVLAWLDAIHVRTSP